MAIYHFQMKIFARARGQNAVACAAYRSGWRLKDYATDSIKHYRSRNERIIFAGIFVPPGSPEWMQNREQFWNMIERLENRSNSRLAREFEIALPHELSDLQRLWLVQDFAREAFVRRGLAADVAIHAPDRGANERNFHCHISVPERQVTAAGFSSKKDRSLQSPEFLTGLRKQWESLANRHLARHGHANRIDCRSLVAQGLSREPDIHLGYVASEMERRGQRSERGNLRRQIRKRNAERQSSLASAMARSAAALEEARRLHQALEAGVEPEELDFRDRTDL